jgi:hypothetical protein
MMTLLLSLPLLPSVKMETKMKYGDKKAALTVEGIEVELYVVKMK